MFFCLPIEPLHLVPCKLLESRYEYGAHQHLNLARINYAELKSAQVASFSRDSIRSAMDYFKPAQVPSRRSDIEAELWSIIYNPTHTCRHECPVKT